MSHRQSPAPRKRYGSARSKEALLAKLQEGSLQEIEHPIGIPIGNLTSQLFANVYLDAFDHFIKERPRARFYIRYTDDAVIVHPDPEYLHSILPLIEEWFCQERRLALHPDKVKIRKLSQGIDFLGYVTLPHHCILRTKTKRRMLKRANKNNFVSYAGLLKQCDSYELLRRLRRRILSSSRETH